MPDGGRTRDPSTGRYQAGFSEPPPGAPRQVSTPVSISASDIEDAHKRAEAAASAGADARARAAETEVLRPPPETLGQTPVASPSSSAAGRSEGVAHDEALRQPARSDTDSPARGLPRPQPSGKEITGGFGLPLRGTEYYALDGLELKAIVIALADRLKTALDGDLRFGLSVVYPQVRVSLSLTVDGRPPDQRARDVGNTEQAAGTEFLEWSRILTLDAEVEDSEGTPAGKIRDDFDLSQPGKHIVRSGATRLLVDR